MNRAFVALEIKALDDDARLIEGWASTVDEDRMGDIVMPRGAEFKLPIPFLLDHNHDQVVGEVDRVEITDKGIKFWAHIKKISEPGEVKDLCDKAWSLVKNGLRRATSIGFRPKDFEPLKTGGLRFTRWEWLELSAVGIPAQPGAVITGTKSYSLADKFTAGDPAVTHSDDGAASGQSVVKAPPGASGTSRAAIPVVSLQRSKPKEANMSNRTVAEQKTAYTTARETKAARMTEIMQAAADKGETLDEAETQEYDGLEGEVKAIDAHIKRLDALEKANLSTAKPVENVIDTKSGSEARGGTRVEVKGANLPKGTAFTRYAMALARSKGNLMQAVEVAKAWHDSTPEVETVLRAAVSAGTTTDSDWAAPLVEYQNMTSEFAELLRPQTIIGRIQGLRRVPFNVKVPRQTAGSSASWVGEGAPKPVSELAFDQITLGMTKLAGIVVITDELARASSPSAEAIVRQDLMDTIVQTMDRDFVDPANAGTANVKPASIINGVTAVTASGTDADDLRADVKALFTKFIAANLSLEGAVWIMPATQALGMSMMLNPLGQPEFPGLTASGGTFFGLPVILSENIPANAGSGSPLVGAGARIILVKASEVLLADDGQTLLDASREASLQMDSAPTNPPVAATVFRSLWQDNLVGIRAERFINWTKRRAGAAQWIDSAAYGG